MDTGLSKENGVWVPAVAGTTALTSAVERTYRRF